jgi:putative acetyltransferase
MRLRGEQPSDRDGIRNLHCLCFPTPAEAELVDRLRADGDVVISAVAEDADRIVGHVLFSRLSASFPALGLAPVAVDPAWRRQGIAGRLIGEGLAQARNTGWQAVFVLGEPAYYRRFGFDADLAAGFSSPYAGPHFMVRALREALPVLTGPVDYPKPFAALG